MRARKSRGCARWSKIAADGAILAQKSRGTLRALEHDCCSGAILAQKPGTLHRTMVRSRASLKGLARGIG